MPVNKRSNPNDGIKYRVEIPNADEMLSEHCKKAAEAKYGAPLPKTVSQRLEKELHAIHANHYASHYLIGAMIADRSMAEGYPVSARGMLGSSLVAHLCGISAVNPLPTHYWCPKCHHFELSEDGFGDYRVMGYDLPDRECPNCKTMLNAEGANVEPEILMGIKLDREPEIMLNVAPEIRPVLIDFIKETFGESNVYRAGVKRVREDGSIKRDVHPGGIFIVPEGVDIHEITAIRQDIPDDDFHMRVTEEDFGKLDGVLKKFDILTLTEMGMLKSLEEKTGFCSVQIRMNRDDVLNVFLQEGFSFLPGQYKCGPFADMAVFLAQPNCFSDLVRLTAMMHGAGTWNHNGENLIRSGKKLRDCIACRDDIMQELLAAGMERERAYEIMNHVRKGKGINEEMTQDMHLAGLPDWYIDSCSKVAYLYPKAHAVEYMLNYWKLAYYYLYFPDEYQEVLSDAVDAGKEPF